MPLVTLDRLLGRRRRAIPTKHPLRLRSAVEVVAHYREDGSSPEAALRWTRNQVAGLRLEVTSESGWARLCELVRRAGDPWNADDWPLGFDGLLCCVPLCTNVAYECPRCPVGQTQGGISCAHPTSTFGRVWGLILAADRDGLLMHLDTIERLLSAGDGKPPRTRADS